MSFAFVNLILWVPEWFREGQFWLLLLRAKMQICEMYGDIFRSNLHFFELASFNVD